MKLISGNSQVSSMLINLSDSESILRISFVLETELYHDSCLNQQIEKNCNLEVYLEQKSDFNVYQKSSQYIWQDIREVTSVKEENKGYQFKISLGQNDVQTKKFQFQKENPTIWDSGLFIWYFCFLAEHRCDKMVDRIEVFGLFNSIIDFSCL